MLTQYYAIFCETDKGIKEKWDLAITSYANKESYVFKCHASKWNAL